MSDTTSRWAQEKFILLKFMEGGGGFGEKVCNGLSVFMRHADSLKSDVYDLLKKSCKNAEKNESHFFLYFLEFAILSVACRKSNSFFFPQRALLLVVLRLPRVVWRRDRAASELSIRTWIFPSSKDPLFFVMTTDRDYWLR